MGLAVYASRLFVSWVVITGFILGSGALPFPADAVAAPAAKGVAKKAPAEKKVAAKKPAAKKAPARRGGRGKSVAARPAKAVGGKKVARGTRRGTSRRPVVTRKRPQVPLPDSIHDYEILTIAARHLGTPYRFGGASERGMDCSGFTRTVFSEIGLDLPHSARAQFNLGDRIDRFDLQPGDLVFFRTYRRGPSHVGIFLGDGLFIHAASRGSEVRVDTLERGYFRARYLGARRLRTAAS